MDYLSRLPVELWEQIVRECISLGGVGPPMDPMKYTRLDHYLMDQRHDYLPSDICSRLRLVCHAFNQMVGEDRTSTTPPFRKLPDYSSISLYTASKGLDVNVWTGDFDSTMEIASQLCRSGSPSTRMQTVRIWEIGRHVKKTVPNFWPAIKGAFPNLVSLFIQGDGSFWIPGPTPRVKRSEEKITFPHLRNLYMNSVVCVDLPFFPQLRYCALSTVDAWDNVYERMPNLQVLHILGPTLMRSLPPPPPTLRSLRCSLADIAYLGCINLRRHSELESLVLFVSLDPNAGRQTGADDRSVSYPDQVASSVKRASQVCPAREIRLLLFPQFHWEEGIKRIVYACLMRGVDVETTPPIEKEALREAAESAKYVT